MNKQETVKILAMLSAYYGQGKSDPEQMAGAWHLILQDYDYKDAEAAVIEFARHDIREYATFPAVGVIVKAIEDNQEAQRKALNKAWAELYGSDIGKPYDELSETTRSLCSPEGYAVVNGTSYEERGKYREQFINKSEQKLLGGNK